MEGEHTEYSRFFNVWLELVDSRWKQAYRAPLYLWQDQLIYAIVDLGCVQTLIWEKSSARKWTYNLLVWETQACNTERRLF